MAQTKHQTQILLIGAGELGLALFSQITTLPNTHTTIGIRSPSNHTALASPSTTLLSLDLSSSSSKLIPIFTSFDIIISATGFASSPDSVLKLANEILDAGRARVEKGEGRLWYFPWQWGVDYDVTLSSHSFMPLFAAQKRVRDLLRAGAEASGVVWTVVSTGIFMSFLFERFWGVVERGSGGEGGNVVVRCLGDCEHGVTVTDVGDIGRVLVRIFRGDVESENRVLYVTGSSVSYRELAAIVERVSGCPVERETWSEDQLREDLERNPEDGIKAYRLAFAGQGVCWEMERSVNHQLRMEMMDVETYARKLFDVQK